MSNVVTNILEGNYTVDRGNLDFSCTKVEIEVSSDCDFEGTFHVYGSEGVETMGKVMTDDARMECINSEIRGVDSEIAYHFHGDLCEEGDVINGSFHILSNRGEYFIPFTVTIVSPYHESSLGPIRNLFGYTNLAKSNWNEAVDLFYTSDFDKIFTGSDASFKDTYRALASRENNSQNVEEFLISTGKKQPIDYISRKKELLINMTAAEASGSLVEREVEIIRNGWGFTELKVRCDGDFLFTERTELTDADFLGNICNLKIFIDTRICRNGKHEGTIHVYNVFTDLEIPIEVRSGVSDANTRVVRSRHRILEQITEAFCKNSLGIMPTDLFVTEAGKLIEQMAVMDETDVFAKIFQARLLVIDNRINEASWISNQAAELLEKMKNSRQYSDEDLVQPYCYWLYTDSFIKNDPEYSRRAGAEIAQIYRRHAGDWKIGILLTEIPSSFSINASAKWNFLEGLYNTGNNSPCIFMLAVRIMNANPSLARKAEGFTLRVINYGIKLKAFNDSCINQILFLAGRERDFVPLLFQSLQKLYEYYDDTRLLQEICSQLIKGRRKGPKAFEWYKKGVEAEIRLTNLYEYYMMSMDIEKEVEIPKVLLMYFSYQNNLDYERMAYLYYCLINKKTEYADVYENNRAEMVDFAFLQIGKGRINKHLAVVYNETVEPEKLDRQICMGLTDLLFTYWLTCNNTDCIKALVYQKGCKDPWEYPLKDGRGPVTVYGNSCTIVLEDAAGNRYLKTGMYKLDKLMSAGKYMSEVSNFIWDNPRLNLYMVGVGESTINPTTDNILRFMQLAEDDRIEKCVRQQMLLLGIEFYGIQEDERQQERCFSRLSLDDLTPSQRKQVFPYLYKSEKYDLAVDWLRIYGPYFALPKDVAKLLGKVLTPRADGKELAPDTFVNTAAMYAFTNGEGSSVIAGYLAKNYRGMTQEMRDIWKACVNYDIPHIKLNERILVQLLNTGVTLPEKDEIAREYAQAYPASDLTKALVAQAAYGYFVKDEPLNPDVYASIKADYIASGKASRITELAFLKYCAEASDSLSDEDRDIILAFLKELLEERIYLGFFKAFLNVGVFPHGDQKKRLEHILGDLEDRTIIDYRVSPGHAARIHYMLIQEGSESGDYYSEIMRDAGGGVCFKDFILFFGEKLKYYITEEQGDEATTTDNGTLQCNDIIPHDVPTKYELINNMLVSNTMKNYTRLDNLLEDYYKKEFLNAELFHLM